LLEELLHACEYWPPSLLNIYRPDRFGRFPFYSSPSAHLTKICAVFPHHSSLLPDLIAICARYALDSDNSRIVANQLNTCRKLDVRIRLNYIFERFDNKKYLAEKNANTNTNTNTNTTVKK
jgi:hypothetical protein